MDRIVWTQEMPYDRKKTRGVLRKKRKWGKQWNDVIRTQWQPELEKILPFPQSPLQKVYGWKGIMKHLQFEVVNNRKKRQLTCSNKSGTWHEQFDKMNASKMQKRSRTFIFSTSLLPYALYLHQRQKAKTVILRVFYSECDNNLSFWEDSSLFNEEKSMNLQAFYVPKAMKRAPHSLKK